METSHNSFVYIDSFQIIKATMSHAEYVLKGSVITSDINRRYSDFYLLREKIVARWPCIFIPELPPKKATGNLEKEFLIQRMRLLNHFLDRLTEISDVFNAEEVQTFFLPGDNVKSLYSKMHSQKYTEIAKKYKDNTEGYSEIYDIKEAEKQILLYTSILDNSQKKSEALINIIKSQLKIVDNDNKHKLRAIEVLHKYEKMFGDQSNFISDEKVSTFSSHLSKEVESPLKELYYFSLEIESDVKGYINALKEINDYKLELHLSKERLLAIQSNGQTTEVNRINALKVDIPNMESIIKIATYRFEKSFKKFKREQIEIYNKKIIEIKKKEIEIHHKDKGIWFNLTNGQ